MSDDLDDILHDLDMIEGLDGSTGRGGGCGGGGGGGGGGHSGLASRSIGRSNNGFGSGSSGTFNGGNSSSSSSNHLCPRPPAEKKSPQNNPNRGGRFGGGTNFSSSSGSGISSGGNGGGISSSGSKENRQQHCSVDDMSIDDLLNELDSDTGIASSSLNSSSRDRNNNSMYSTHSSQNNSYNSINAGSFTRDKDYNNKSKDSSLFLGISKSNHSSNDDLAGEGSRSSFGSSRSGGGGSCKCLRLVLSGDPSYARGAKSSIFTKTACNNLRCSSCNFQVMLLKNGRWNDGDSNTPNKTVVDYMFFRNNMPNLHKLEAGFISNRPGDDMSCGYCCQCSWVTVSEEEVEVNQVSEGHVGEGGGTSRLPWICGGH